MLTAKFLKSILAEARPIIERQLNDADLIAGIRDAFTEQGGDWGALKALAKSRIQDERDEAGDGKRVKKMLGKAGSALAYADMLGLNMNEDKFNSAADSKRQADTAQTVPSESADAGEQLTHGSSAPHPVANVEEEANGAIAAASVDPASREVDDADRQQLAASGFTGEAAVVRVAVAAPIPQGSAAADKSAGGGVSPAPVAPRTHNPETHFLNSKGLQRLHGCQKPDSCGTSQPRVKLCFSCSVVHDGPTFQPNVEGTETMQ